MKFTGVVWMAAVLALTSGHPQLMFSDFVRGILESEETDDFDVATLHVVDPVTYMENGLDKEDLQNHANDLSTNHRSYSLQFSSGQELGMSVTRHSIDTSGAIFTELTEEGKRESIDVDLSECFFSGPLDNAEGFASLSLCEGEVVGSISTPDRDYHIHTLSNQGDVTGYPDDAMVVLVTWEYKVKASDDVIDSLDIPDDEESVPYVAESAERRSVANHRATIEICDVVDKFFVADLARKMHITTNSKIIELLITKWSGAAHMLSNVSQVGWDIDLRLVRVDIMRSHPDWYEAKPNQTMGSRLNQICRPTASWKCDHITVHTGQTSDRRVVGLSWVGGVCKLNHRCSAMRSSNPRYMAELHELGHNLGLKHDKKETRCTRSSDQENGFMGGNAFHFRECYKEVLAYSLANPKKSCIFTDAINMTDIVADFHHKSV